MSIRPFLGKISGAGQRQRVDDAIDASMGVKKPAAKPAPSPARQSPPKKAPGRPAKSKNGLRDFFGL